MSLIEQAAKRLEQLRQAGVELPEDKFPQDLTEQVQVQKDTEPESRQATSGSGADTPRAVRRYTSKNVIPAHDETG